MIFCHDVFRDWAVANLIHEDQTKLAELPLAHTAPASLARGIELAARLAIEGSSNGEAWKTLLDRLEADGVHGTWRRAVLMALVRSERAATILDHAYPYLFADSGRLLKDLIGMVMALEVAPVSRILVGTEIALPDDIAEHTVPTGPTWHRLAIWLFGIKDQLPANLIPVVAELFVTFASAVQLYAPSIAEHFVSQLHTWLMELEREDVDRRLGKSPLFLRGLDYEKRKSLHEYLRSAFAFLSAAKPELAADYLRFLLQNRSDTDRSAEAIVKKPGNLAKAAPKALAELTAATLINQPEKKRSGYGSYHRDEPFSYADKQFLWPSPARGPFLALLFHSPKDGLSLIRQLVVHACTFDNNATSKSAETITIELKSGPRCFLYPDTYYWSRISQGAYCVTSALMSLEAWGHIRIENGDDVNAVISDILGDSALPAAYLLVIVDLLLSHWPKSEAEVQSALARDEDGVHRFREGLQFNPIGIATVGTVSMARHRGGLADARHLLELAVRGDPAAAHGFGAVMDAIVAIDARLPVAVLRCAFAGCIRAHLDRYEDKDGQDAARLNEMKAMRETAVEAEWAWLQGTGAEPNWPEFPPENVYVREKLSIGGSPRPRRETAKIEPRFYADHQAAAIWLSKFLGTALIAPEWLRRVANHYRDWTSVHNGAGLNQSDELSNHSSEWNYAYFKLVACSLPNLSSGEIDELCLAPVLCLPDESFLDVTSHLLPSLDTVYFEGKGISESDAVRLRTALADRMQKTWNWRNFARQPGYGLEIHLKGALGPIFLSSAAFGQAPRCYLTALGVPNAAPFIPLLTNLSEQGPSLAIALMTLGSRPIKK